MSNFANKKIKILKSEYAKGANSVLVWGQQRGLGGKFPPVYMLQIDIPWFYCNSTF